MMYQQCEMQVRTEQGVVQQTAWIPAEFAFEGSIIDLQDRQTKVWHKGWVVTYAGEAEVNHDYIVGRSRRTKFDSLQD
jgi:hypothetical protein